jgi:hypothetical protein
LPGGRVGDRVGPVVGGSERELEQEHGGGQEDDALRIRSCDGGDGGRDDGIEE